MDRVEMIKIVHIIPLVLVLVDLVGAQYAHATNESSYKYGYKDGYDTYNGCGGDTADCDWPDNFAAVHDCERGANDNNVTNSTACFDGFINGWKHWCNDVDPKTCAWFTTNDFIPAIQLNAYNKDYLLQYDPQQWDEGYKAGLNGTSIHGFHIQNFMDGYSQGVKDREYSAKFPAGASHVFHPFHPAGT
jgi:hypothetical protein